MIKNPVNVLQNKLNQTYFKSKRHLDSDYGMRFRP